MDTIIAPTKGLNQSHGVQLNFNDKHFNFLLIALGAFICIDATLLLMLIS
ncbi:MAG: hypothetical protein ACI86X_002545 [Moritella sp.]|jgi:hypothetical protein